MMSSDEDDSISFIESLNFTDSSDTTSGSNTSLTSCLQRLATLTKGSASSTSNSSSSSFSSVSTDEFNILITGSKCTGKSSLCETLLLLISNTEKYRFEYMDVNQYRNEFSQFNQPLSEEIKSKVLEKLLDGYILVEDSTFDIYCRNSFSVIFILKTDDDELERRLISHGDFHTPYNDFHVMKPYNSVCDQFPHTRNNKIFILDNTLDRHLDVNARFIKQYINDFFNPPENVKNLDSDGESHRSDSDVSDANETLIHSDGKFKKTYDRARIQEIYDDDDDDDDDSD